MGDELTFDFKKANKFLKNDWNWIILIIILIGAFYFRSYHLDYPVIGYHNWKEVHYLSEARNFARDGFFKYGFFIPAFDYPSIKSSPTGAHTDTFPTASIITGFFFKIFGETLKVARVVSITISIFTVLFTYLFLRRMFKRDDIALLGSALLAINPLNIFFSHNTQMINPGLLFMIISGWFYFKWHEEKNYHDLVWTALFFMLSFITKYSFFVFAIPLFFTFPIVKEVKLAFKKKKNLKPIIISVLIIVIFSLQLLQIGESEGKVSSFVTLNKGLLVPRNIFKEGFWATQEAYTKDNFTMIGLTFAILGLIFISIKQKKGLAEKFTLHFIWGSVLWFLISSNKLAGHNYYYYSLIPLFIILVSYCFMFISVNISNLIKLKWTKWIFMILLIATLISPSMDAKDRMFNTQFFGLDIAGDYIKYNKEEGDRIIHSSHQAYGILWHGDIKGTSSIPTTLEDFKFAEDEIGTNWLFIYNWDFAKVSQNRELWAHISENYRLVQTAFTANQNQLTNLYYFLFRKGGSFNESLIEPNGNLNIQVFSKFVQDKPMITQTYEFTTGSPSIYFVNIE